MKNLLQIGKIGIILAIIFLVISCCPETTDVIPEPITKEVVVIHADVDFDSMSCSECHADVTPEIYTAWKESGHGKLDYGCYICHGDGLVEYYPTASTDGCVSCHSNNEPHLARFEYGRCFECHDGHSLSAN